MAEGHIEVGENRGKKLRTIIRKIDGVEKHEEVVQVSEGHIIVDSGTIKITEGNVRVDGSTIYVSGGNINVSGSTIKLSDGTTIAEIDQIGALAVIELEHHKVHQGLFYIFTYQGTWDTDLHYCVMKTPSTQSVHCKIAVIASNPCEFNFYEDSTTNGGSTYPAYNANRQSSNISGLIFAVEPTVSDAGLKIDTSFVGTQNPRILIGGDTRPQAEWILKKNAEYTLAWQAAQAGTRVILLIEYYEVFPS